MKQSWKQSAHAVAAAAPVKQSVKQSVADDEARVEAKAKADVKATEVKVEAAATAQEQKLTRAIEASHKLGSEVQRLRTENEKLNRLRDGLEQILKNHGEVGDQLRTALARSQSEK